jgi:hypothetical protein
MVLEEHAIFRIPPKLEERQTARSWRRLNGLPPLALRLCIRLGNPSVLDGLATFPRRLGGSTRPLLFSSKNTVIVVLERIDQHGPKCMDCLHAPISELRLHAQLLWGPRW